MSIDDSAAREEVRMNRLKRLSILVVLFLAAFIPTVFAGEQPLAIFHAFNDPFTLVESYVCELAGQGYSHVQISPAQKSNPARAWYARYQPVDFAVIEGMGTESDLKKLTDKAHECGMKVLADVVFNHMSSMDEYKGLDKFPGLAPADFHGQCGIDYSKRDSVRNCWLGGDLPDLDQSRPRVQDVQKAHIRKLLSLGIDGFRFDAAKHIDPAVVKDYIDLIDRESNGRTWNYLEVIEDDGTQATDYNWIAAVTDFVLYKESLRKAFGLGGDLRLLKVPVAVNDSRSIVFGRNHDTVPENNQNCIVGCYDSREDSYLATAYVLARESGVPLVLNWDNYDAPYISTGVKFRQIMTQRGRSAMNVKENVLGVIDSPVVMMMERGSEGFFVLNKSADRFDIPVLDLTLTNLEGCYRELRRKFTVAIERKDGKKFVTRWGRWDRGGLEIYGRDALYFIREPWEQCR
jgi:alpha-amylase